MLIRYKFNIEDKNNEKYPYNNDQEKGGHLAEKGENFQEKRHGK